MTKTKCTVCNHSDLEQIHKAQAAGNSHAKLADLFSPLSAPALQRHFSQEHGADRLKPKAKARNPKLLAECGKPAHDVQATLTEGFEEQDRAQAEALSWGLSNEELAARIIELRKVCNRCGRDLLPLLPESFRSPYDRNNPLHEKQNYQVVRR